MRFIEHIIEPTKLLLAWQSSDENHRKRYIVAEITRVGDVISLSYLSNSKDFKEAQDNGFEGYPAFPDTTKTHGNVLDAFMRRLPPRSRGDFVEYLQGLRLKPDAKLTDFALLGYSGAKLLSDGFSIIHPFNGVESACELLIEAAGYRFHEMKLQSKIQIGSTVNFHKDFFDRDQENCIGINVEVDNTRIGYVPRGLISAFNDWLDSNRINGSWVEKMNGTPEKPTLYIYVSVSPQ